MVRRIYVEKKAPYAVRAKELADEMREYLGIGAESVRVLIRYDVQNVSDATFGTALTTVFSEPPVDDVYEEDFPHNDSDFCFTVEYLPGQFDQRADSAEQCVCLLNDAEHPIIKSATTYVISGKLTDEQRQAVVKHCVNPVDSRRADGPKPDTLEDRFEEPADVIVFDGFKDMGEVQLRELYGSLGLAMTFADFRHIQNYFHDEERRDPTMTEIRVLDTYWSDHCRHTTFATELKDVQFDDGFYRPLIEGAFKQYLADPTLDASDMQLANWVKPFADPWVGKNYKEEMKGILLDRIAEIKSGKRQAQNKVGNMMLSRPTDELLTMLVDALDGKMPSQ